MKTKENYLPENYRPRTKKVSLEKQKRTVEKALSFIFYFVIGFLIGANVMGFFLAALPLGQ